MGNISKKSDTGQPFVPTSCSPVHDHSGRYPASFFGSAENLAVDIDPNTMTDIEMMT